MENIKIALVCGLCAGCKNAINLATNCTDKNVILYKEIVHNNNINNSLKSKGILLANNLEEIKNNQTVIIRAHGEPPETYNYLNKHNIKYLDGTCKNVKSIHNSVENYSRQGYQIILIGKYGKLDGKIHPEILGTIGYSKTQPILIEDIEDVEKLKPIKNANLFLICQTTFNPEKFNKIKEKIENICNVSNNHLVIKNSICGAQKAIQKSSIELAKNCDLMIVVGGKHSSNTFELFNNIKDICPAIHIENINDFKTELKNNNLSLLKDMKIGITAGASTNKQELEDLKLMLKNEISKL